MRRRGVLLVMVTVALLTVAAPPASAEWFADLYLGGAFTAYNDLTAQFGTTLQVLEDVEYDAAFVGGARFGYWFPRPIYDRLGLGLAVDVSHFQPDIDSQVVDGTQTVGGVGASGEFTVFPIDISVLALSLDLMLRWPVLPSPQFPNGRLHPYFAIGPAVFFTEAEDSANFIPGNQSDSDTAVGFKMTTGVAWSLTRNLAVFGEWRFTYFSPEWRFSDGGAPGTVETDISTFHTLVGVSFRF